MASVLRVDNLSCGYNGRALIGNLDFTLRAGTIGCLLGPSGCGKTTFLRTLAGFESVLAGHIFLGGLVLGSPAGQIPPEQRQVGLVFQNYALFPHLSVAENIGFGLFKLSRAEREARVTGLLELIGLPGAGPRRPWELSGGEQQRVALARAMAPEPELLLLDEPFSNLDADLRHRLRVEVKRILHDKGISALLVTHDQQEALGMADTMGVIGNGQLLQWDSPYEVYHQPSCRAVAELTGPGSYLRVQRHGQVLKTPFGTVTPVPEGLPERPEFDLLVRPDDLLEAGDSQVRGRVCSLDFAGATTLYELELSGGERVLAELPSHSNHPLQEEIGLRLEPQHWVGF